MDIDRLISPRARAIDASGIRRVFELGATLRNPINLSIGQPDFPVPDAIKDAAVEAIAANRNGYTLTQGIEPLRERLARHLAHDIGWDLTRDDLSVMVTSGTSGALVLAFLALIGDGDEAVIPDPYFVLYPHLASLVGGRAVLCDTYPDFKLTAERVEPLITERTKLVLANSPGNPSGAVMTGDELRELLDLCRRRNVLLISDEIYDEFTYAEARTQRRASDGEMRCPSPCRFEGAEQDVLLVRGFGKTYGVTGWRMGYAAGPTPLIEQLAKMQQYTYVCAPSMAQWACIAALDVDMGPTVSEYQARRDRVLGALRAHTDVETPGGAFYAFVPVPERLGITASEFAERCVEHELLVIPGGVFSSRDTHFRLSYAAAADILDRGIDVLTRVLSA